MPSSTGKPSEVNNSPPAKVSPNGLVAWWTFEDALDLEEHLIGPRSVLDVTENRFRTPLTFSKKSVMRWIAARKVRLRAEIVPPFIEPEAAPPDPSKVAIENSELLKEDLPVPSFREKCLCPFEVRRHFLAQRGRALMTVVPCPSDCGDFVRKIDLRFHKKFMCSRRRVKCRYAGYCDMSYFLCDQEYHEQTECDRLIKLRSLMDTIELKNALDICQQCAEPIRVREMNEHLASDCPFRLIACEHPDCPVKVPANQMKQHLKFSCQSKELHRTSLLIARARKRLNYPRPWGITVSTSVEDGELHPSPENAEMATTAADIITPLGQDNNELNDREM